jgi:hypothetical protein
LYNRPEVAALPSGLSPTPLIIIMIVDEVSKRRTNYREAISSEQRLAIFLR